MTETEFSRPMDIRQVDDRPLHLSATEGERAALARRFAIMSIGRLEADLKLDVAGDTIAARGRLRADIVQSCAVSGDDLAVAIDQPIRFRFVPETEIEEEELELGEEDCDDIPFNGQSFDLGEAVAQSLALAIDPYATGPGAEQARREAGILDESAAGAFAALAALKKN